MRTVVKREARIVRERELGARQAALPEKKYGVILADPEWEHEVWSKETGQDRSAAHHFPVSDLETIASRPVESIAADDSVLLLWCQASMIELGLYVMGRWGYAYKSQRIWAKDRPGNAHGTGRWFWDEHEVLLLGTRGHPPAPTGDIMVETACRPGSKNRMAARVRGVLRAQVATAIAH